jgi:hypothetical protein
MSDADLEDVARATVKVVMQTVAPRTVAHDSI